MINKLYLDQIVQVLTQSTRQLDAETLSALVDARQNALRKQAVREPALAFSTGSGTRSLMPDSIQQWVVSGLFVAMLIVGTSFWHQVQEQQISELDVAILTDDLPIEVFVD
jgi:hypothetical protein